MPEIRLRHPEPVYPQGMTSPVTTFYSPTDTERTYLQRCIELAQEALDDGDDPFGSVLVTAEGDIVFEDRNRVKHGDHTRHPEFEIARWSASHLSVAERAAATVYTSGEHCPMCAAAHAWVGLGRIVYASASAQLVEWLTEWNLPASPVAALPINHVAPGIVADGPVAELTDNVRRLHAQRHGVRL